MKKEKSGDRRRCGGSFSCCHCSFCAIEAQPLLQPQSSKSYVLFSNFLFPFQQGGRTKSNDRNVFQYVFGSKYKGGEGWSGRGIWACATRFRYFRQGWIWTLFLNDTHDKKKIKKIIIISKGSYFKSRCACFFFVCSISRDIVYVCFLLFVDFNVLFKWSTWRRRLASGSSRWADSCAFSNWNKLKFVWALKWICGSYIRIEDLQ